MPKWAGKWMGGRFYLDAQGRQVFFIERKQRVVKLQTHDEQLAVGQLATFLQDPEAFCRKPEPPQKVLPVYITTDRLRLYMESIRACVADHRKARRSYLLAWSEKGLDLRTVDRATLRQTLSDFKGGHRGRTEALNAFCRFLVKEGDLPTWNPLVNTKPTEATRAEQMAYSVEQLRAAYARISEQPYRDLFLLRAATGLHQTEIDQLEGARIFTGPLPDKGTGIRTLGGEHVIQGVLQVMHKSKHRHRQSVSGPVLEAALRLREYIPSRIAAWEAFAPLTPSNLRHTFVTLAGECGEFVTYTGGGVDRSRVAQAVGHRAGSTMTADRYEKIQVPPMIHLPLGFP